MRARARVWSHLDSPRVQLSAINLGVLCIRSCSRNVNLVLVSSPPLYSRPRGTSINDCSSQVDGFGPCELHRGIFSRLAFQRAAKMTVITKAITEKKASDKMEQPLFVEENATDGSKADPEAARPKGDPTGHYFVSKRSIHRIHVTATFLLFLVALMILIIGVIGGLYIYKQYARTQMRRFRTGWYSIPYDSSNKASYGSNGVHQGLLADSDLFTKSLTRAMEDAVDITRRIDHDMNNFFKERFEIDLENERYEKIDVPDFRGGRQGRFIHDFNINKTGIIDIDGHCCFVMPLNRQRVLPPRNMYDLLRKMYNGYYEVDTAIVRETMKVITPPITDMSVVGTYIARECQDLPIYMLKKVDPSSDSVVKRSVSSGVFGQFAGNSIMEVDIVNLEDFE